MIPLLLGEQKFNLPISWEEITIKQWLDLREIDFTDICSILAVLTGIDRDIWFSSTEVSDIEQNVIPQLEFLADPIDLTKVPLPKTVTIGGKQIEVPTDIGLKTYGQKIIFQREMLKYADAGGDFKIEFMPRALAIYLCPEEKFTDAAAIEYQKEVEQMKVVEAYPVACFFLSRLLKSWSEKVRTLKLPTTGIKKQRESNGLKSLASRLRSMLSRKVTS